MRLSWALALLLSVCLSPVLGQETSTLPPAVGQDAVVAVKAGESLYTVARAQELGLEHLAFANGLPVSLAPLTQKNVLVPKRRILPQSPPGDGLVLNLPERGVFLFREGEYRGFFPVAIGGLGWETPVGEYQVAEKTVNPVWYPPAWAGVGHPVMPGPQNPLGDRWIGLSRRGYGIHSTDRPDSIGGAVSHGCIRTYPEHARRLYEQVYIGMPIRIEYHPVKLGRDPETGRLEMSVFPDVYGRVNLASAARELLSRQGLQSLAGFETVTDLVAQKKGVVTPVFGRRVTLKRAGDQRECSGFLRQGRLYVESSALRQLGLYDTPLPAEQVLRVLEKEFVPAATALTGTGLVPRWDGASRTLYLEGSTAPPGDSNPETPLPSATPRSH